MVDWRKIPKIDAHIHLTPKDVIDANIDYDGRFIVNGSIDDYEKIMKTKDEYDTKDDEFPGLVGKVLKLPIYKKDMRDKIPVIKLEKKIKSSLPSSTLEIIESGAICQHYITWDNISAIRTKNPNKLIKAQNLEEIIYDIAAICNTSASLL